MNRKGLSALVCALTGMTFSMLASCSDDLDVQQSYPFTVETMPVPTRIVKGETVEIRCELKREGRFSDARYTVRYFQPDGEGTLRMDDGMVLLPNDRYPLDREVPLSAGQGGVPPVLYFGMRGPAEHRHLFRGQQRAGAAFSADFQLQ